MDRLKLVDELERDEALRLHPYWDCGHTQAVVCPKCSKGLLTIGIGRNLTEVGITKAEAYHLCHGDIDGVVADLDAVLPWWRQLDEIRQRVLMNMCFNMGIKRLRGFPNFLAAFADHAWDRAADEMKSSLWYKQVGPRAVRLENAVLTGVMP